MRLAMLDIFRARWTTQIHEEWISNLLKNRPDLTREKLDETRRLMDVHVRDSVVEGYEALINSLELPDPNDRHVLAAAIHSSADAIITFNLKDFPSSTLQRYGMEALDPDDFIVAQFGLAKEKVLLAARQQRENLRFPPKSIDQFLADLERSQLVQTAAQLRRYRDFL